MSAIILPFLYPVVTPFVAYYTIKYATGFAVNIAIDKTKNAVWYVISYPFKSKQTEECIKCKCEKCKKENCEKIECRQGYEIIDLTDVKEKMD
jgi:hypothetical protein